MSENELFKNEIKILPELQHKNVAKLVGFCTERRERTTVYEFMQNGSLENIIFGMSSH
jgi:serine/threonine protein kinase